MFENYDNTEFGKLVGRPFPHQYNKNEKTAKEQQTSIISPVPSDLGGSLTSM